MSNKGVLSKCSKDTLLRKVIIIIKWTALFEEYRDLNGYLNKDTQMPNKWVEHATCHTQPGNLDNCIFWQLRYNYVCIILPIIYIRDNITCWQGCGSRHGFISSWNAEYTATLEDNLKDFLTKLKRFFTHKYSSAAVVPGNRLKELNHIFIRKPAMDIWRYFIYNYWNLELTKVVFTGLIDKLEYPDNWHYLVL